MKKLIKSGAARIYSNACNRVMDTAMGSYDNPIRRALCILLMDMGLFAGFLTVIGIPMRLLGIAPGRIFIIGVIAWLAMDTIACAARRTIRALARRCL